MSIEQRIASAAMELVSAQRFGNAGESEYRSFAEGFPILLRQAGLVQSVLFCRAKGGHPHGTYFDHLQSQLHDAGLHLEQGDLAQALVNLPSREYRLATQLADRVAYWHKRMAQAYLRTKKELGAA